MNVRLILLVALLSGSSAASAKKFQPPMPVQNLQVEVVINQQELAVDVPDTAANIGMQFGAIGGLIGGVVMMGQEANAERVVADLRHELIDYRFNEVFERQLRAKLASEGLSPNPQFTFMASPIDVDSATMAGKVAGNGILIITPRYSITNNFEVLQVSMNVRSVNRTFKANGKPKEKTLFWRNYSFKYPMAKVKGSLALEDSKRWVGMGKLQLHGLLEQASSQVIDMLVYEFSPAGRELLASKEKPKNTYLNEKAYWGWSMRQDPKWIWVREFNVGGITGYHPITGERSELNANATAASADVIAADAVPVSTTDVSPEVVVSPAAAAGTPEAAPAPAGDVAAPVNGAESN